MSGTEEQPQPKDLDTGERLLFGVPQGGTEDLDESMISGAIARQTAGKIKDVLTGGHEEATGRRTGPGAAKPG